MKKKTKIEGFTQSGKVFSQRTGCVFSGTTLTAISLVFPKEIFFSTSFFSARILFPKNTIHKDSFPTNIYFSTRIFFHRNTFSLKLSLHTTNIFLWPSSIFPFPLLLILTSPPPPEGKQ